MTDPVENPKQETTPKIALENLHPSQINLKLYENEEEYRQAENIIGEWHKKLSENIRSVLREYGVEKYQLSYIQTGTEAVLLTRSKELYIAAKLASSAARVLQEQVIDELNINIKTN